MPPVNKEEIMLLTKGLAMTALAVGSLLVGKQYYQKNKLYSLAKEVVKESERRYNNCFTIDRLIDSDCDGEILSIGINGNIDNNNILSHQGIRLGQYGDIKRLVSYIKTDNSLVYRFEDNICLTLTKKENNKIMYSFEMPGKTVVKDMDDRIVMMYKTIGMASSELDKIAELKKSELQ
jgi:hypothetical protein